MEDHHTRTLVILLSMHRCGSSLTANILQRLGLSLGPFELNGAAPSNPLGHFEAMPFLSLNRDLQGMAFGFPDDLPDSPRDLARFRASEGQWPDEIGFPDDLLEQGRSLIRELVASGRVSGFKDPRTVLTWPFWERVLEGFPDLRVVPVNLVRSPHEISMSLASRRKGWCSYWDCLDVIAVHLRRQEAIVGCWDDRPPSLCFGSPTYLKRLEAVAPRCGLAWDATVALDVFDASHVHQAPAAVPHVAQSVFHSLAGDAEPQQDPEKNQAQLERDARSLDALRLRQWQLVQDRLRETQDQFQRASMRADEVEQQLLTEQTRLVETERRRDHLEERLDAAFGEILQLSSRTNELQARLNASHERELQAWRRNEALRERLERYESHPILGPALRGRRRLRRMIHGLVASSPKGSWLQRVQPSPRD